MTASKNLHISDIAIATSTKKKDRLAAVSPNFTIEISTTKLFSFPGKLSSSHLAFMPTPAKYTHSN